MASDLDPPDSPAQDWVSPSAEYQAINSLFRVISRTPKAARRHLQPTPGQVSLSLGHCIERGTRSTHGNILCIHPWLTTHTYTHIQHFLSVCRGYLDAAKERDWLHPNTVVVFPEHIGTWLVGEGEIAYVYDSEEWQTALQWVALSRPVGFLKHMPRDTTTEALIKGLFWFKASRMASQYQLVFSRLARHFGVTIVAGSILLASPSLKDGKLKTQEGPLHNVGLVFSPDGSPSPTMYGERSPSAMEQALLSVAPFGGSGCAVYETPAGPCAVALGRDVTHRPTIEALEGKASSLLHPCLSLPFMGGDTSVKDEAAGFDSYLTSQFWGQLWELEPKRRCLGQFQGEPLERPDEKGASLVNLWRTEPQQSEKR